MPDAKDSSINSDEKLPAYTNHNGFLLPVGFPTESFDSARNYEAQDNGKYTWYLVYYLLRNAVDLELCKCTFHVHASY